MIRKDSTKKLYKVDNVEKYLGNPDNIVIRSSWELHAFKFCDHNKNILGWSSEEIGIPYMKPMVNGTMRPATYYPDLYVEYLDRNQNFVREVVEIKPYKQSNPSTSRNKTNKLYENMMFIVNLAKWDAAKEWCTRNGMKFSVATERSIFKNKIGSV